MIRRLLILQRYASVPLNAFSFWLVFTFAACTSTPTQPELPKVELSIVTNLSYKNGYYYMPVNQGDLQTLKKIGGRVMVDGTVPERPRFAQWVSDLYWTLEWDNATGRYVRTVVRTTTKDKMYVPTVNSSSYTDTDGYVYTMIAPIKEMKGDTMTITLTSLHAGSTIKIILQ